MSQTAPTTTRPAATEPFEVYDEQTAPKGSRDALAQTKASFGGMIPNLERVMAGAPVLLKGYATLWDLFGETSLSPSEQQVVYQTANFENDCGYCVPWHTYLSERAGMAEEDVQALRQGRPLSDPKEEALRQFTKALLRTDGNVSEGDLEAFFEAGYAEQQAMEVVLGLAVKTMSNYTNSIAQTPLDEQVQHLRWEKPRVGKSKEQ